MTAAVSVSLTWLVSSHRCVAAVTAVARPAGYLDRFAGRDRRYPDGQVTCAGLTPASGKPRVVACGNYGDGRSKIPDAAMLSALSPCEAATPLRMIVCGTCRFGPNHVDCAVEVAVKIDRDLVLTVNEQVWAGSGQADRTRVSRSDERESASGCQRVVLLPILETKTSTSPPVAVGATSRTRPSESGCS
jgi:hypothetical protein